MPQPEPGTPPSFNDPGEPAEPRAHDDADLRLLVDNASDFAMILMDPDMHFVQWSKGAENVLGWTENEVRGQSCDIIFTPEDRASGAPRQEQETARRVGRAEDERWHLKKDGTRIWGSGVMVSLWYPNTRELRGFGKVLRDVTGRKLAEDALQQANETLEARIAKRTAALLDALETQKQVAADRQALQKRVLLAVEDERRRLSRDLHDNMGQHLAALTLNLKALEAVLGEPIPETCVPSLDRLRSIMQQMGRDIHRLAVELRPTALDDLGLAPALRFYVEQWQVRTGKLTEFAVIGVDTLRFGTDIETAVYRIVQEALTNVAKYAPTASQVSVTLQRIGTNLQTIIEDNGPGFDPEQASRSGRLGLHGMKERAALVGGTLDVESAPGEGTTIYLRIPV